MLVSSNQIFRLGGISGGVMVEDTHQPPSPLPDREARTGGCLREVVKPPTLVVIVVAFYTSSTIYHLIVGIVRRTTLSELERRTEGDLRASEVERVHVAEQLPDLELEVGCGIRAVDRAFEEEGLRGLHIKVRIR